MSLLDGFTRRNLTNNDSWVVNDEGPFLSEASVTTTATFENGQGGCVASAGMVANGTTVIGVPDWLEPASLEVDTWRA